MYVVQSHDFPDDRADQSYDFPDDRVDHSHDCPEYRSYFLHALFSADVIVWLIVVTLSVKRYRYVILQFLSQ